MKKAKVLSFIVALICCICAVAFVVTADQISLDSPASLPSDI